MIRDVFTIRLRPGALGEWKRRHEVIWPELVEEMRRCGVVSMAIFADDPVLFVHSEVLEPDSWDRLLASPVHKKWVEYTSDLSLSAREDRTVARQVLPEVFYRLYMPEALHTETPRSQLTERDGKPAG